MQPKTMEMVKAGVMGKSLYQSAKGWVLYMGQKEDETLDYIKSIPHTQLKAICEEFSDIFKEMPGLPPRRTHDHHIHLLPGSETINLRLY